MKNRNREQDEEEWKTEMFYECRKFIRKAKPFLFALLKENTFLTLKFKTYYAAIVSLVALASFSHSFYVPQELFTPSVFIARNAYVYKM